MTTIKRYNNSTGQWEVIVAGKQGEGVPAGGATNQILVKTSGVDYETTWGPRYPVNSSVIGGLSSVHFGLPNTEYFGQINISYQPSTLYLWPFAVNDPVSITAWATRIVTNTVGAASTIRAGVYQMGSNYTIGSLVQEFPILSISTGTTGNLITSLATPLALTRGRYFIAWNKSSINLTMRGARATHSLFSIDSFAGCIARIRSGAEGGTNVANPLPASPAATLVFNTDTQNYGPAVNLAWSLS